MIALPTAAECTVAQLVLTGAEQDVTDLVAFALRVLQHLRPAHPPVVSICTVEARMMNDNTHFRIRSTTLRFEWCCRGSVQYGTVYEGSTDRYRDCERSVRDLAGLLTQGCFVASVGVIRRALLDECVGRVEALAVLNLVELGELHAHGRLVDHVGDVLRLAHVAQQTPVF